MERVILNQPSDVLLKPDLSNQTTLDFVKETSEIPYKANLPIALAAGF